MFNYLGLNLNYRVLLLGNFLVVFRRLQLLDGGFQPSALCVHGRFDKERGDGWAE
ncbi:MAG: hypothetical protein KI793_10725 [Rivularia sp. (in: Bacteria)]|nr:hypothetical protein [Rivularia sp. MS3]